MIRRAIDPVLSDVGIAASLGLPIAGLGGLGLRELTTFLRDLSQLGCQAGFGEAGMGQASDPQAAIALLSDWPTGLHRMLNVMVGHSDPPDLRAVIGRQSNLLSSARIGLAAKGKPFEFLAEAVISFLDSRAMTIWVDPRLRTRLGVTETTGRSILGAAAHASGLDTRALKRLGILGSIRTYTNGRRRVVVEMDDLTNDLLNGWKTVGIREAAAMVGVSVATFKECVRVGVFQLPMYQSVRRGYSKHAVESLKGRMEANAGCIRINPDQVGPRIKLGDFLDSSRVTTAKKVELVSALLELQLTATRRAGRGFRNLVISVAK